jgi:hypothetical protein
LPRIGEIRNACQILVEKSVMKSSFKSLRRSGRRRRRRRRRRMRLWLLKSYTI